MSFKTNKTPRSQSVAFAACSFALDANGMIQLLPAGQFRSRDGRPTECAAWLTNADIAAKLIADIAALSNPVVIDYEHQTILSAENGQKAPAAGWFTAEGMVWRDGEGLFAKVEWTDVAKMHIDAREYKFISPVILYDKKTGAVKKILNAALTNNAAIDGMEEVSARLTASLTQQETPMKELLAALGLAEDASEASALAALAALTTGHETSIAALKTAAPDPAKFVPVDAMAALQTEVATLRTEKITREVDSVVVAALSAGKLLPPQEKWARDLGTKDLAALTQYLETAQGVAALSSTQTKGKQPAGEPQGELSESELAMCRSTGVSPEDFKKTKLADAQAGS